MAFEEYEQDFENLEQFEPMRAKWPKKKRQPKRNEERRRNKKAEIRALEAESSSMNSLVDRFEPVNMTNTQYKELLKRAKRKTPEDVQAFISDITLNKLQETAEIELTALLEEPELSYKALPFVAALTLDKLQETAEIEYQGILAQDNNTSEAL